MAQIRGTIDIFTKILRENGTSRIKAETFRQAKFNQEEAVAPMWKLLFEIIYYSENGRIDDISVKACGELSPEELIIYVKRELQKRGFYSRDFSSLPNDMTGDSREILLAIGWLICKESIIQRFMRNCTSPLQDEYGCMLEDESGGGDNAQIGIPMQLPKDASEENTIESVKQMLWYNNKLQLSLRTLFAMQREKLLLRHKVHEATQGVSTDPSKNHLSMLEVYMMRHPDILKKNLQLLEKDNERLQNLLKWKDHEDIFWKWMESVLDTKIQEKTGGANLTEDNIRELLSSNSQEPFVHPGNFTKLKDSHLNLREAIVKYESIVEHLDRLWDEQSSDVTDDELNGILSSIDLELSIQKATIALNNCDNYLEEQNGVAQEPEFIFQKKSPAKKIFNAPGSCPNEQDLAIKDIEDEIDSLNDVVNSLEQEINDKRDNFKEEMQSLSAKFKGAVSIPPMVRKY